MAAHERLLQPHLQLAQRRRRDVLGQVPLQDRSGVDFLTQEDGDRLAGEDGDYHQRDLFTSIEDGNFPSWTLHVQIMPFEDAKTYRINRST